MKPNATPLTSPNLSPKQADYIVAIGASAGGLEAIEHFFRALPCDTGFAYVIIQHLSPDFKSLMDELIARYTKMSIVRVEKPTLPLPNTIYLLPPRNEMILENGLLTLTDRPLEKQPHQPITRFFRSLAREKTDKAIAIILSGTGSDGSLGLTDIHDAGGLVFVQSEASAKFDGMPRSAISTGYADGVYTPEGIAQKIALLAKDPAAHPRATDDSLLATEANPTLHHLFERLHQRYKLDFTLYKPGTIFRRIQRRATLLQAKDQADYIERILNDESELDQLYHDFLIGVTRFFRDPEAFDFLQKNILPDLIQNASPDDELRIWIAGCATGEEAYSIAILLSEELRIQNRSIPIKIFATDMHRESLFTASKGIYSAESLEHVPEALRHEYFHQEPDGRYLVKARLRQLLHFSPHNLVKDVPFTRLDLITCRNLLIYLEPTAQMRALSCFHFALKVNGTLFLGPSESLGDLEADFTTVHSTWKIYRKHTETRTPLATLVKTSGNIRIHTTPIPTTVPHAHEASTAPRTPRALSRVMETILSRYVPSGVVINERRQVIHIVGKSPRFLRPATGPVTNDLSAMTEGQLNLALSSAIQTTLKTREKTLFRQVPVDHDDGPASIDLTIDPITDPHTKETHLFIQFHPASEPPTVDAPRATTFTAEARERISYLETELQSSRDSLQTALEEKDISNEELQAANEELQSTNEELLSSNEELQSTNEELHSVNEELYTVNAEHEQKIRELAATTADLRNLITATHTGILFLDSEHRIRLFTPGATQLLNLLPHDIGRPVTHITSRTLNDNLAADLATAASSPLPIERQVSNDQNLHYLRRVSLYRDANQQHTGYVITYIDLTSHFDAQRAIQESERRFREISELLPQLIWTAHPDGTCDYVSQRTSDYVGAPAEKLLGHGWLNYCHPDEAAKVFACWQKSVELGRPVQLEYRIRDKDGVYRWFDTRAIALHDANGKIYKWLGSCTDIDTQKQADDLLRESEQRFRQMADDTPVLIWLSDPAGNRTYFNRTWLLHTGAIHRDQENMGWLGHVHPEDRDRYLATYHEAHKTKTAFTTEYRLRKANDSYAWIYAQATPRFGPDKHFHGLIGCCIDITEQKNTNAEQRRLETKLLETAKLESLGVLAGGIAHDFNNLLTGILGNTSYLQAELPEAAGHQRQLSEIEQASLRAADLCKQMLAYSGRSRFFLKKTNVSDLVKNTLPLIRHSIGKNANLRLHLDKAPPLVEGDVSQLQQIVMNLVINASEAIGEKIGDIYITTQVAPRHELTLETEIPAVLARSPSILRFEVRDTGCGISPENLTKIFDPFFTTKFTGRGLGLAAVQGIVRSHHAILRVQSAIGQGTSFTILFPASYESTPPAPRSTAKATPLPQSHILIVDDEEFVRNILKLNLGSRGFQTTIASSGDEAIELFRATPDAFSLVLLDLTMPGKDGHTTFGILKQMAPDLPIILMSGYSETEATAAFESEGLSGFLAKPITNGELISKITEVLRNAPNSRLPE